MKFENIEIESLAEFLFSLKLRGKHSRMRTRFLKALNTHLESFYEERTNLIKEYAQINEDGTPKLVEGSEKDVLIKQDKLEEFSDELSMLYQEEIIIEESETNEVMILSVADSVLNSDIEVSELESIMYDNWCEKFEKAIAKYALND